MPTISPGFLSSYVLNLRLVSPAFLPLFSSFKFWSSRFESDGERGFLFEVKETITTGNVGELLHLYRLSRRSVAAPSLLNRERVWKLAQILVPLVDPSFNHLISSQQTSSPASRDEIRLAGKEQLPESSDEWKAFKEGYRSTTTIDIDITNGALEIGIAVASTGVWDYVTGIRLVDQHGKEQMVGYSFNDNEIIYNVTELRGFRVAMGPGGVRALQVLGEGQQASRYSGRTEGMPLSERLMTDTPAKLLSVTLDVSEFDRLKAKLLTDII